MLLIGRFMSPFVRRVGVVLETLGVDYEQKEVATDKDAATIMAVNPVGRVPALILDNDEHLFDSNLIIEYLLDEAGGKQNLLPAPGPEKRAVRRISGAAVGTMEKAVAAVYERNKRPEDFWYDPWRDNLVSQVKSGADFLEAAAPDGEGWMCGDQMTLADIDATIASILAGRIAGLTAESHPKLMALAARCQALPAFEKTVFKG